jgi:hypothetical protein
VARNKKDVDMCEGNAEEFVVAKLVFKCGADRISFVLQMSFDCKLANGPWSSRLASSLDLFLEMRYNLTTQDSVIVPHCEAAEGIVPPGKEIRTT